MWFLLIPPAAVLLALLWMALRSRPTTSREAMVTIEGYRRSMAALARSEMAAGQRASAGAPGPDGPGGTPGSGVSLLPARPSLPDQAAPAEDLPAVPPARSVADEPGDAAQPAPEATGRTSATDDG